MLYTRFVHLDSRTHSLLSTRSHSLLFLSFLRHSNIRSKTESPRTRRTLRVSSSTVRVFQRLFYLLSVASLGMIAYVSLLLFLLAHTLVYYN